MAKYSFEFKKKLVLEYLTGKGSYRSLAQKYDIPNKKSLQVWVNAYKELEADGLLRSR